MSHSRGVPSHGVLRVEDPDLLTGRARFLDDLDPVPGTLHAAIVRSPVAHGRIGAFDASEALRMAGVRAVIGPAEVEAGLRPFSLSVETPMAYRPAATDRVRYVGEPVGVVVAADRYLAEDAAERVRIDYEEMPVVSDVESALAEDAPLLHPGAGSNVATDRLFVFGEVEAAFERADRAVEADFAFPRYSSTPIETYGVIASFEEDGQGPHLVVWSNFHGPFVMQPLVAGALGLPPSVVRFIVPGDIGGSFGIKSGIYPYMALIALASKHAGAPVRWIEDRYEHLVASNAGAGRQMQLAAAVDETGRILGLRLDLVDDVGAYLRPPEPSTLYRCYGNMTGPYRIEAVEIRARAVVTNKAPTGLNRGFGGQQLYFGLEGLVDLIANQLEVDPADIRRRNFVSRDAFPYRTPTGGEYDSGDYQAALDLALKRSDYEELQRRRAEARARGRYFGIGMSTVVDPSGTNLGYVSVATPAEDRAKGHPKSGSTELVTVSMDPLGEVTVALGSTPQGQGHRTVARQVVAERLGLPVERVRVIAEMDTALTPWTVTSGSYSSRFAPLTTSALVEAADRLAETLRSAAAVRLGIRPDEVELAEGRARRQGDPERSVPLRHAAGLVHWDPGSLPSEVEPRLHVQAAFSSPHSRHPGADDTINSSLCYGFVADVVAVEIDPDTLEVQIVSLTSVHDSGTVLHEALVEGQVLGAIAHALGGSFLEELRYGPDGQPLATTFMDYLCPTAAEMDFPLVIDHMATPSPRTRLGAKGVGEGDCMSIPAAIANAVNDALRPHGVRVDRLPITGSLLHGLLSLRTNSNRNEGSETCP